MDGFKQSTPVRHAVSRPFGDSVTRAILHSIECNPDRPCLSSLNGEMDATYGRLYEASLSMAALLQQSNVQAGDVVLLFLPTGLDGYAGFLGAMLLGAIPGFMPLPSARQAPQRYWQDHAVLLARTTPRAILTDAATAEAIEQSGLLENLPTVLVLVEASSRPLAGNAIILPSRGDIALLQHSSGTTGLKKGVMLSHDAILNQVTAYAEALAITDADIVATWLPVYHDMGLISSTLLPLMLGLTVVVLDPFAWVTRPATLFEAISRHRATLVWQPNFAFEHLCRTVDPATISVDLSCIRAFINCSEQCRPETFARFAGQFECCGVRQEQLQCCYAMAETVFAVSQTRLGVSADTITLSAAYLGEMGRARKPVGDELAITLLSNGPCLPGMSIRLVRSDGSSCSDSEVGEIMVSGSSLFDGYFCQPEPTAERLLGREFKTHDMGLIVDGHVYVLGRMDDMIVVHGRNFYAGDIEAVISRVAGVRPGRAVALGVDNLDTGSKDAVVVAEAEGDPTTLRALSQAIKREVLQSMGLVLQEACIVQAGWLSKTTSGKISRKHNLTRYLSRRRSQGDNYGPKVR